MALGLPALIFYGYSHVMESDYFSLTYVDVEGLYHLDEETLLESAEAVGGEHILDVKSEHLEATMRSLPFVRDVEVERRFPDRLHVKIQEYDPAVIVVDDGFWLSDHHGEVFLRLDSSTPEGGFWHLPLMTGLTRAELGTESGRAKLRLGLEAHAQYEALGLHEVDPVSEIHVDDLLGVSLVVGEVGTEIRLGRGRWKERLERFAVIRQSLSLHGVQAAYMLIDHESDLSRVAVGPLTGPGSGDVDESDLEHGTRLLMD